MKTYRNIFCYCLVFIVVAACRKDVQKEHTANIPTPTPFNLRVAAVTGEVADILKRVYEDDNAVREVNAAVFSGYYEDERVILRDLLFPDISPLYDCRLFRKLIRDTGFFRKRFYEIVASGSYPIISSELRAKISHGMPYEMNVNESLLYGTVPSILSSSAPISIYFPYSENFGLVQSNDSLPANSKLSIMLKPTIVYTDRDADSAPGMRPYFCLNGTTNLCYISVTVDDAYAELRPTHIVTTGAVVRSDMSGNMPKSDSVTMVYNGWSRLNKQMDKLVSFTGNGGGSEIKVCRLNGYLRTTGEQIASFAGEMAPTHFTRADIRKKRFKRIYSVWDPNWNIQDIEQVYAVYEDDNRGSATFTGSLKTTLNLAGKIPE